MTYIKVCMCKFEGGGSLDIKSHEIDAYGTSPWLAELELSVEE